MRNFHFILLVSILLFAAGTNYNLTKDDSLKPRKSLKDLPKSIGEWRAIGDHKIDDQDIKILKVDDYILRSYHNSNGDMIGLYIGYFKSQREGKGIHSPRQCLPGGGWLPVNTAVYQIPRFNYNPETVSVNKLIMEKGLARELYFFWYQGRGRIYASEYWNKIYLVWDGLTKNRTDGALIRVNSSIVGERDENETMRNQIQFIELIIPLLNEYIPD